jgi:type I restriction enzyme S subunit
MPEYLYAFFQSDDYWLQISDNKEGSAQPNVNGRKLLSISVPIVGLDKQQEITRFLEAVRARQEGDTHPLPELASPLDDQSRTVSYIEELAGKVAEATRLQKEITKQMDALCRALITSPPDGVLTPTQMSELLVMREPDVKVEATFSYHFAGVYCFGRGVFAGHRKNGSEFAYRHLTKVQKGNFIYPKLMAWEGALGVVPENCDGLYVSPEFPVFEVRKDRVLPEVLDTYFRMPSVWSDLAGISTGTNVRRRRLHPRAFLQYKFPLPSMKVQHQFCVVRRSIEQAKRVKSESAIELDALMPSILSKAFRGEL